MDRRTFLKYQAAGLLWAAVGAPGLSPLRAALADAPPDVAVVKGSPAAATRAAVDMLGGMGRFVKPGYKVLIKPNMSFAKGPDSGTTTHPEVVRELLIMCKEAGAAPGQGPGPFSSGRPTESGGLRHPGRLRRGGEGHLPPSHG